MYVGALDELFSGAVIIVVVVAVLIHLSGQLVLIC